MSKRILVVEDQEDNMQILRDLLVGAGYEMVVAENGEEALAAVAKQRPDLILMDIQLPIMDGYEATRRIKADPASHSIPIIAVTSYALSDDEAKAGRPAATTLCRSPTARVSSWRRFASIWPNSHPLSKYPREPILCRLVSGVRTCDGVMFSVFWASARPCGRAQRVCNSPPCR